MRSFVPWRQRSLPLAVVLAAGALLRAGPAITRTVYAIAVDRDDAPVTDLGPTEWRLQEDGTDRPIVDVRTATDPIDLMLLVDTSRSTQDSASELRAGLTTFAHAIVTGNPGAMISVVDVAAAAVTVASRKTDPTDIDTVLKRTYADRTGGAVILEALVEASKTLARSRAARRAIVVVHLDGVPDQSRSTEPQAAIDTAVASGASVWCVSYRNDAVRLTNAGGGDTIGTGNVGQLRDLVLTKLPGGTGGLRIEVGVPTALTGALQRVAQTMLGQYAITYTRPEGPAPRLVQMGQARAGVRIVYPTTAPR